MIYFFVVLAFLALEIWLYIAKPRYTFWILIVLSLAGTVAGIFLLLGFPATMYYLMLLRPEYGLDQPLLRHIDSSNIALALVLGFLVLRLVVAFLPKGKRVSGLFVGLAIAMAVLLPIAGFWIGLPYGSEHFHPAGFFFGNGVGLSLLLNWMFPIQKYLRLRNAPRAN